MESIRLRCLKLLRDRLDALADVFPGGAHLVMRRHIGVKSRSFERLPACVISWSADGTTGEIETGGYQAPDQGHVGRSVSVGVAIKGFHEEGAEHNDPNEVEWTDEAMDPLLQAVIQTAIGMNKDPEFLAIFSAQVETSDGWWELVAEDPDPAADVEGAAFMGSVVSLRLNYQQSAADPAVP